MADEGDASKAEAALYVVDGRTLDRECIAQSLRSHNIGVPVIAIDSFEQWLVQKKGQPAVALLINIGGQKVSDPNMVNHLRKIVSECGSVPVVLLAEKEDMSQILKALECGVRGYIPASVGIDVCVEAIRLAMAGGTFVPASSVLAMRHAAETGGQDTRPMKGMFTQRQAEVVKALRRGKANKIIAYELNLRESTVKVHIRNIMKKLKATNRTEVAYMINDLFPSEPGFADAD
ncbi:DNA-binding response regulator [Phyllobacterium salinisoli]|uniref:DNA-binding response regulator n=1 Tax=Phyllobacterium salinisoli TaxID=1899321 RepID=A0A368JZS9_9HYPH|nr:response regulator transcription factor [Phyllobacterium salinisoli]RCS22649.1 DNA-binding response regulator [Phyllobacterium salinisoli]